ncbi:MAG: SGNH/GDSL hydrolase family protein [Ruminococcaceae bacterium]|nr:SGNH/GDSL hydrolase family protein [Oscillospiraceae bacterium]
MNNDIKQALLQGEYLPFLESAILNNGNQARIAKVLKKAQNGEDITIVTLGGSITSGAWATCEENRYATRISNWFKEKFPNITVNFQNAGISATPSIIGVHRVAEQVLSYDPDFVTVDFEANDTANDEKFKMPYENLIRRILMHKTNPAVLSVVFGSVSKEHKRNENALSLHLPTIKHYDIPAIDYFGALWEYIDSGVIAWSDVAADTVHPNDNGHLMSASCITNYLNSVLENLDNIDTENYSVPNDFVFGNDAFMNANFLKADKYTPALLENFEIDNLHADKGDRIMGWSCDEKGGTIVFAVKNVNNVSIFIQKTPGNSVADIYINNELILSDESGEAPSDKVVRFCHSEFLKSSQDVVVKIVAKGKYGVGPLGVSFA